jgi:5-methyltetrahydrofolate--homocysteine methyltransferase
LEILHEIGLALQAGDVPKIKADVQKALDIGVPVKMIINEGMLTTMAAIGVKFKNNEVFVPEVLIAAHAMNEGMAVLKPFLVEGDIESAGKVVLGTVKGDLHDIGKNMVRMMLEGVGFEVFDLGIDVPAEKFAQAVKEKNPQIVAISALLTTTMPEINSVIEALKKEGVRDQVAVMIGGAPVTQKFADEVGADLYAKDAGEAASVAKNKVKII